MNPKSTLPTLVCASANPDKVAEMAFLLRGVAELLPRPQQLAEVVEDASDLWGNARLKATAVSAGANAAAVSDDTGLEVDALGGAPGVYSARFAGEEASYGDNVEKLLAELARVGALAEAQRTARFRTVAMVIWPDGSEVSAQGTVEGVIASSPRGHEGFGYDSVFVPHGETRSFAEMGSEKHALSHRGRAFRALAETLRRFWSET